MIFRDVRGEDFARSADHLDGRTLLLSWLVSFFRRPECIDERVLDRWRFLCGGGEEPACVVAHDDYTGAAYVSATEDAPLEELALLFEEDLLPSKLQGELGLMLGWEARCPEFFAKAASRREIAVFEWVGGGELPPGFRAALRGDLEVLAQFEEMRRVEDGDGLASDMAILVDAGLLFVLEEEGRILGFLRSNLSDGRRVHAGGLWVHPLWRRRGVGRRLALGIGARVRAESGATAVLDAYRDNEAATRAYAAAGYREAGAGFELEFGPDVWG